MPTTSQTLNLEHAVVVFLLVLLALFVLSAAGLGAMFYKAGRSPLWAIVPIANFWILLRLVRRSPLWLVMLLVLNVIAGVASSSQNPSASLAWLLVELVCTVTYGVVLARAAAAAFGQGPAIAVGLFFFPWIFWLVLGFGSAQYVYGGRLMAVAGAGGPEMYGPYPGYGRYQTYGRSRPSPSFHGYDALGGGRGGPAGGNAPGPVYGAGPYSYGSGDGPYGQSPGAYGPGAASYGYGAGAGSYGSGAASYGYGPTAGPYGTGAYDTGAYGTGAYGGGRPDGGVPHDDGYGPGAGWSQPTEPSWSGPPALFSDLPDPAVTGASVPAAALPTPATAALATAASAPAAAWATAVPDTTAATAATEDDDVGWHAHPDDAHVMNYWDGASWSHTITWNGSEWIPDL